MKIKKPIFREVDALLEDDIFGKNNTNPPQQNNQLNNNPTTDNMSSGMNNGGLDNINGSGNSMSAGGGLDGGLGGTPGGGLDGGMNNAGNNYTLTDLGKIYSLNKIYQVLNQLNTYIDMINARVNNKKFLEIKDQLIDMQDVFVLISNNIDQYIDKLEPIIRLFTIYIKGVSKLLIKNIKERKDDFNNDKIDSILDGLVKSLYDDKKPE